MWRWNGGSFTQRDRRPENNHRLAFSLAAAAAARRRVDTGCVTRVLRLVTRLNVSRRHSIIISFRTKRTSRLSFLRHFSRGHRSSERMRDGVLFIVLLHCVQWPSQRHFIFTRHSWRGCKDSPDAAVGWLHKRSDSCTAAIPPPRGRPSVLPPALLG